MLVEPIEDDPDGVLDGAAPEDHMVCAVVQRDLMLGIQPQQIAFRGKEVFPLSCVFACDGAEHQIVRVPAQLQ